MGNIYFWLGFILFILFIYFVNRKNKQQNEEKKISELSDSFGKNCQSVSEIQDSLVGSYLSHLQSKKQENDFFVDEITWNDLNLKHIYNIVNRTLTSPGEEVLYAKMHSLPQKENTAVKFSEDMDIFAEDIELRERIWRILMSFGKMKSSDSFKILSEFFDADKTSPLFHIISDIILIATFGFIFVSPGIGFVLFLCALIFAICSYFKGKAGMDENLRAFCYILKLIKCSESLSKALPMLCQANADGINRLTRYQFLIPTREGTTSNPLSLILDYIRMIFHVDLILYSYRLSSILEKKEDIFRIYENIGYIDCVLAVASYRECVPKHCHPKFVEGNVIEAIEVFHPLTRNPVYNDISVNKGVLITGSNASGKSTFLKMIGISVLFAQSFGFAFAKEFKLSPMRLFTSMALNDNIVGKESYYVVETRSLKRIIDAASVNDNVLCIIDEVLRGTNTSERIAASCEILRYFHENGILCLVATHDIELASLLKDEYLLVYFSEEVVDGNVMFPYKLSYGINESGNAIRLLESMGYSREIVDNSRRLVEVHNNTGKWGL